MEIDEPVQLGPYRIDRRLGTGGMADVWHAVHQEHQVEVAVKVLRSLPGDKGELRFRREVQAVAMLMHPGIVRILDYGKTPNTASFRPLGRGASYFVMEYADAPSLGEAFREGLTWRAIRGALLATLDALAHAHARGVIHRDLKPDNILGFSDGRWKLADFGIASLGESGGKVESNPSGTPAYMSPEQFQGMLRDMGPWTDLYSIGCLAWELVTGSVPFEGESTIHVAQKHFVEVPPDFEPQIPVPDGFEAWVRRLLSKVPHERYLWAADAAWALSRLASPAGEEGEVRSTSAQDATVLTPGLGDTLMLDEFHRASPGPNGGLSQRPELDRTPIPDDWRVQQRMQRTPLDGASARLVGLRVPRVVGREKERDAMWNALHRTAVDEAGGAVLLRGAAGCGKSRLVRWLTVRSHELGLAASIRAVASREPTPNQTPAGAIAEHLGFDELEDDALEARLQRMQSRYGWSSGSGAVVLETFQRLRTARTPPTGWEAACDEVLTAIASNRPLIVWIDDLQWAPHWMAYLDRASTLPGVLFVATVRAEEAVEGPVVDLLQTLAQRETTVELQLSELPVADCARLVSDLLRVVPPLAHQIAQRADGNPMFATQLVTDWVTRGLLVPRSHGWELREGIEPSIPEDVTRVWSARVAHLLEGHPPTLQRGLELAAVLGKSVRFDEYEAARSPLMPAWGTLGDVLASDGLVAEAHDDHWEFVHEMLREAIVRRARSDGELQVLHARAAEGLQRLQTHGRGNYAARIGTHLFEAGRYEEAVLPLRRGAEATLTVPDPVQAGRLLALHRRALDRLGRADGRERWEGELVEILRLSRSREVAATVELAHRVIAMARTRGWSDIEARAQERLARVWNATGDEEKSGRAAREALRLFNEIGDLRGAASALLRLGDHHSYLAAFDESRDAYHRAIELARDVDEVSIEAWAHYGLGFVEYQVGDLETARRHLQQSIDQFASLNDRYHRIVVGVSLADVERMMGNFERARELYLAARALRGGRIGPVLRLNICLLELGRGQIEAARSHFMTLVEDHEFSGEDRIALEISIHGLRAFFHAVDDQFDGWAREFEDLTELREVAGILEFDTAYCADLAVREAIGRFPTRHADIAGAVDTIVGWWTKLGRHGEAQALRRLLMEPDEDR